MVFDRRIMVSMAQTIFDVRGVTRMRADAWLALALALRYSRSNRITCAMIEREMHRMSLDVASNDAEAAAQYTLALEALDSVMVRYNMSRF